MTDKELVQIAQLGRTSEAGRRAASELFERYQEAVYLWCFRYAKDHESALDLSQDVFLRAYERLDSFEGRSKFSSWLFSITRNHCWNKMQKVPLLVEEGYDFDRLPSGEDSPDLQLEDQEDEARILELIRATLDPLEQKVIWFRCFERMPVDEITRVLDIGSATGARGVLQTARRKLKAALKRN